MKQWVRKLLSQFEMGTQSESPEAAHPTGTHSPVPNIDLSEDRATLLYLIDIYSKNLIEVDSRSVRKVREIFDEFAKGLLKPNGPNTEKLLFRFRQFFSGYRIQEYTYLQKTFEDFKSIIWDFADQLNENIHSEQARDNQVRESLDDLREAVEANSIDELKQKSREFIDFYIELQNKNEVKRSRTLESVQKSLANVKQKLVEINQVARRDHLTGANNRKSFDEHLAKTIDQAKTKDSNAAIALIDIDHFKKVNDIFGHDAGDYVLKNLSKELMSHFGHANEFVARIGGEEFAVISFDNSLPDFASKIENFLDKIRKNVIIYADTQIRLTVSAGIAQFYKHEDGEKWLKRADLALYESKNSGRDKYTVAAPPKFPGLVA